jgi:predicted lipoprotein with Yx(FWY)xxD motif
MRRLGTLGVILAMVAAACTSSDADESATTNPPATAAPSTTTTEAPTTTTTEASTTTEPEAAAGLVALADSSLGSILVDGDGNVLYLFTPDEQGESVCYDECAGFWPPLVGEFAAGDGVDAALMGSVARTDGSEQVTYNGWPLYYFANDAAPGDTNGQGVNEVWYVLDAAGDGIGLGG